ncbi:MAG TPA: exodeoxyribonuclease V subunit alpha [Ramlibacter sp.]|nr:exodeoxyribonuclease V subunit alpha [Ramlibacter sp.]
MNDVQQQLESWVRAGWVRDVDAVFAAFLAREAADADPMLLLAAALASHQLGRGHVCLDLDAVLHDPAATLALPPEQAPAAAQPVTTPAQLLAGFDLARWRAALRHPRLVGEGPGDTPLVLAGPRLYLRRYWQHEQSVREAVRQRWQPAALSVERSDRMREALAALFPAHRNAAAPDWQKVACALAARARFAVITGGPGTGKTTTVVKLLALLQHLALHGETGGRRLRIRLAAPTGKAAARLNESIAKAVQNLPLGDLPDAQGLRAAIPVEVTTVHRLLGTIPGTRRFRHDARQPLPLDVLVLDEASMLDLEMMAAVVAALPAQARLVLLGDKDQLASVEAGGVLGELCRRADQGHYRDDTCDWIAAVTGERIPDELRDAAGEPLDQCVVKLRHSYRFDAGSGIGQLAAAVNEGDVARVREIRKRGRANLAWVPVGANEAALRALVLDGGVDALLRGFGPAGYRGYLEVVRQQRPDAAAAREDFDGWARAVLKAYGEFQLLCAVRQGPWGVERLNERIAALLHAEGLLPAASGWYLGRPVLVTQNDYTTGLMNGDVGVTLALPVDGGGWLPRVAFPAGDGDIRWVLPSRLRHVETVFAMTVHKSQGSEFDHAALVIPDLRSRVLTRELVYTGITRARHWFTVALAGEDGSVLEEAIRRRTLRSGGLISSWAAHR